MIEIKVMRVVVAVTAACLACGATRVRVWLQPEERATLRVGQFAVVELPASNRVEGGAGSALVLVRQTRERGKIIYLYRAARRGDHVLLAAPRNIPTGHCISCVTGRYFVTVVR